MKAYFISLGCPKNLTDTEVLMGKLTAAGHEVVKTPRQADMIIINTCAFLQTARDEAMTTIKEMAKWRKQGKKVYIAGCLPKYWKPATKRRGFQSGHRDVQSQVSRLIDGEIDSIGLFNYCTPRIKATPPWYAYVKIAEGCNNYCAYCLIPRIRGKLKFRPAADVIAEVKGLAKRGVKEVIFIAQDTTAHPELPAILSGAARIAGIRWIRLMYTHPAHLTDALLDLIARERKIVKYLDLPIQHACDKILKSMNRRYTRHDLETLISKIRRRKIALRTSVIVGFPGEGETEFRELLDFVRRVKFERLGCFTYQREKGTPAAKMRAQVSPKTKIERFQKLMRVQARVTQKNMIGNIIEVLVEGGKAGKFVGRSYLDAPEIDGSVIIRSRKSIQPGEIVKVRITGASAYDLCGCLT
ncbi:MAG: 30S ribosomal protein S12 methylthiotransferase RimO [Candidatus Margulisbacteria bacterium]|nr:30S ribosomal protein S12 methylthiotransferase RimO [Candidatus Margulisiibacteriota bacterium]